MHATLPGALALTTTAHHDARAQRGTGTCERARRAACLLGVHDSTVPRSEDSHTRVTCAEGAWVGGSDGCARRREKFRPHAPRGAMRRWSLARAAPARLLAIYSKPFTQCSP